MVLLWGFKGVASVRADPGTLYVDGVSGSDTGDCTNPADPCATIGYAVDQATDGDSVLIAAGTYTENIAYDSKTLVLRGGYAVSDTAWESDSGTTVVDGNNTDRVFFIHGNDSVLEDLTIVNGHAPDDEPWGGGIWVTNGNFQLRRTVIMNNVNSGVEVNSDFGPAHLTLEQSVIANNTGPGGGLNVSESEASADVVNVLIYGKAEVGIRLGSTNMNAGELNLMNSTVADNTGFAGINIEAGGDFTLTNSIVWANSGDDLVCDGTCTVTYSDVQTTGVYPGTGNINTDPLFVGEGNYRLQMDSLCIDTGTNTGAPDSDLDQKQRPLDGDGDGTAITDMGAYEFGKSPEEPASGFRESSLLVPQLTTYIPTPLDISTDPEVIGANIGFAAAAMILLTFAITILNKILKDQEINLQRVVSPLKSIGSLLTRVESRLGKSLGRRSLLDLLRFAGIFVFYGLVFSLLDPGWNPLSVTGFYLFITMALAFGVVGIADDLVKYRAARRWGADANLKLRPANLLLSIASTTFSRLLVLVPGIMFGTPAAFEVDETTLDEHKKRRLLWITLGTMFVIGISLWTFTAGTALLQKAQISDTMAIFVGGLEAFLLVVFAVAVQNLFVQMLAFPGSVGSDLKRWNRWVWGVVLFGISFAFYHTLINPEGNLAEALKTANVRNFYLIIGIFVVGTVIVWLILWVKRVRGKGK